jgi:hypothetical protein
VLEDASSYTHGFLWRESSVLHLSWKDLFRSNTAYLHLETPKFRSIPFKNYLNSRRETMYYML